MPPYHPTIFYSLQNLPFIDSECWSEAQHFSSSRLEDIAFLNLLSLLSVSTKVGAFICYIGSWSLFTLVAQPSVAPPHHGRIFLHLEFCLP